MNKARVRLDKIAALVFWGDGAGFDRTAVVAPGLPYETSQDPLTPLLVDCGFGVIQPQYVGSFDSEGKLTPKGCIDTLLKLQKVLRCNGELYDLRGERRFRVGRLIEVVTAHSFGTFVAVGAILRGLQVRRALMLSPMFEFGEKRERAGIKVDVERHVRHIACALPLTFRLNSIREWRKFFVSEREFHPAPKKVQCISRVQMMAIVGRNDASLDGGRSREYVTSFVHTYSQCLDLVSYSLVDGATHEVKSLLIPPFDGEIRSFLAG